MISTVVIAAADRLTFAAPHAFALAALVPVLVLLRWIGERRKERGLRRLIASGLRPQLVIGESPRYDLGVFAIEMLGLALVIAALARPQWGEMERKARSEGRNLIVAIDTSRSMLAADLEPDRLTRAKLAADDLVRALPNDRIGVMAFAGNAVLQVPLTIDHGAISESLEQLDIYSVEKGGTNIGAAIELALEHFGKIAADHNALVLFTDGEDLEGDGLEAAEKAAEKGVLIIAVGVGSTLGAIVPDAGGRTEGQFIRDRSGELVKSRLDIESLEKIAARTHGVFINLNSRSMNSDLLDNLLARLDRTATEAAARTVPVERYQWPLAAGTTLLALCFIAPALRRARRFLPAAARARSTAPGTGRPAAGSAMPVMLAGAVALCLMPAGARAGMADEAWQAFNDAQFAEAVDLYARAAEAERSKSARARLEFGRGAAAYRDGQFDTALDAYAKSLLDGDRTLRGKSHYNLGNTLFRRGEKTLAPQADSGAPASTPSGPDFETALEDWKSAVRHFDDAATLDPDNDSARHNANIVRKRIEELEEQQQQQQQQENENQNDEKKDPDDKEQPQQSEGNQNNDAEKKDQPENPGDEPQDGDEDQGEDEGKGEPRDDGDGEPGEDEGEGAPQDSGEQEPGDEEPGTDGQPKPGEDGQPEEAGEAGTADGEGEAGDRQGGAVPEDAQVNPDTGYSKLDAARILEMLADEQYDLKPIRRRGRIQQIDDW